MRKLHFLILLAFACIILGSCLKKTDLIFYSTLKVSGEEAETLYFSTVSSVTFDVQADGGEELRKLQVITIPTCSWNDTTIVYNHYLHTAHHSFTYIMSPGHNIHSKDSVYEVFFSLYTDFDTVDVRRYIKFKYVYPDLDSFDVHVGSKPSDDCLISIDEKTVFPYTQYLNRRFDLVFMNELRSSFWGYGTCLASPTAPACRVYFADKVPELPYRDTLGFTPRETYCGYVPGDYGISWRDFNEEMLGNEENWQYPIYINFDNKLGYGVSNLQLTGLYKFRLHNGRLIMVRVLGQQNVGFPDCQMDLRIYYQK